MEYCRGSILEPVLLNIFINDPEVATECTLVKFADDALKDRAAIQRDLDRL